MKWRTRTRPNHVDEEREHVWGWDVVISVVGILLAIGAAWISVNREVSSLTTAVNALADEFHERVKEAADQHKAFVPRSEFEHHNHGGTVPSEGK